MREADVRELISRKITGGRPVGKLFIGREELTGDKSLLDLGVERNQEPPDTLQEM